MKQKFEITGMSCAACSGAIEKGVSKLDGVSLVNVSLLTNSMWVTYEPSQLTTEEIVAAVERAGYGAALENAAASKPDVPERSDEGQRKASLIASFAFMLPLMYVSMGHMMGLPLPAFLHGAGNELSFAFTQFLLALPVAWLNRHYYQSGFRALLNRRANMDSLIAIGSGAALLYGVYAIYAIGYGMGHARPELVSEYAMNLYFESGATILTLVSVGKYLEARSKGKTSEALTKLMRLAPKTATLLKDGEEIVVPASDIRIGDVVVVRAGEAVPVDGVVLRGGAAIDQSALTGESMPVDVLMGDTVAAATLNRSGYLEIEAQRVGADTMLSEIIRLVEDASVTKAPIARLADRISGFFVPVVMAIAVLAAAAWLIAGESFSFALSIGVSVLVISCPCALGLATPVAIMVGMGKGAQLGILFKSAEALERLHAVDAVVLDKTGTLTEGTPRVTDVLPASGIARDELIRVALALEKPSSHPLAEAVKRMAEEKKIVAPDAQVFHAEPGRGVSATVDGLLCLGGNIAMLREAGLKMDETEAALSPYIEDGKTVLFFARGKEYLGAICVADALRETSPSAVARLRALGMYISMITGDNAGAARAVERAIPIDRTISEALPGDKERELRRLMDEKRKVAMIGDGINDAPALARADVGIAIGAGTDIAMESADVVLIRSDLSDAAYAVELSRAVMRNIRQNLFWAFFYNIVGIPLAAGAFYAAFGWTLNPMIAAAAMSLSSVCVVANALRLRFFVPTSNPNIEEVKSMKREITIEGMSCEHCKKRVEQALTNLPGVASASVDLKNKCARVELSQRISDDALLRAVTDAGYDALSVKEI